MDESMDKITPDFETWLNVAQNASDNYKLDRMELMGFEFHLIVKNC